MEETQIIEGEQERPYGPVLRLLGDALVRENFDFSHLLNVHANVSIVLGEQRVTLREISKWGIGAIIELDRLLGEPVDLFVNDEPFAQGEIVVVNDRYGMRITAIHQVANEDDVLNAAQPETPSRPALPAE